MAIQYWWWLLAIALGIAELFTGGFYLLVLGAGAAGAGLTAALGFGATAQFICAAIISAVGAGVVRRLRPLHRDGLPSQRNPDVNIDIGQAVQVEQWDANRRSRVAYRGAMWDVELLPGEPVVAGSFLIREIDGSRLRLSARSASATAADSAPAPAGATPDATHTRTTR